MFSLFWDNFKFNMEAKYCDFFPEIPRPPCGWIGPGSLGSSLPQELTEQQTEYEGSVLMEQMLSQSNLTLPLSKEITCSFHSRQGEGSPHTYVRVQAAWCHLSSHPGGVQPCALERMTQVREVLRATLHSLTFAAWRGRSSLWAWAACAPDSSSSAWASHVRRFFSKLPRGFKYTLHLSPEFPWGVERKHLVLLF